MPYTLAFGTEASSPSSFHRTKPASPPPPQESNTSWDSSTNILPLLCIPISYKAYQQDKTLVHSSVRIYGTPTMWQALYKMLGYRGRGKDMSPSSRISMHICDSSISAVLTASEAGTFTAHNRGPHLVQALRKGFTESASSKVKLPCTRSWLGMVRREEHPRLKS